MPTFRRGLPRTRGGEPWPPADVAVPGHRAEPAPAPAPALEAQPAPASVGKPEAASAAAAGVTSRREFREAPSEQGTSVQSEPVYAAQSVVTDIAATPAATPTPVAAFRRGLPRVAGGDPWPPAGFARLARPQRVMAVAPTPET